MTFSELGRTPETIEPPKSEFIRKLEAQWEKGNFVCVGLDSDYEKIPQIVKDRAEKGGVSPVLLFNAEIIDQTHNLVCAYKPNSAFYEAHGEQGLKDLADTVNYIKTHYPDIPVILDAKRADIDNTNIGYVQAAFDQLGVDAITVHPYLGYEALKPFLNRKENGIIVLSRTSNKGAGEFQDQLVGPEQKPLYQVVAQHVAELWNTNGNCAVVVGATYPRELAEVRKLVGDMPILIPGIGAQGGEIEATVKAGKDSRSWGMIINSSRGIIFASNGEDFAQAARLATEKLRDEINKYRPAS